MGTPIAMGTLGTLGTPPPPHHPDGDFGDPQGDIGTLGIPTLMETWGPKEGHGVTGTPRGAWGCWGPPFQWGPPL